MADSQRKKNEEMLLITLACGATVETAAKQCGLTTRTIYRRLKEPEFQDRLQALRSEMVQRTSGMLTAAGSEAVRTLLSLQKEPIAAAVRLGAARAILELGVKIRELVDIQTRLAILEQVLSQAKKDVGSLR